MVFGGENTRCYTNLYGNLYGAHFSKSVCGQPHVGSNPTVSARAGSDFTLPAFLYRLLCTIFGTASEHTIHCICRSLLRIVIQVSVDVCCCGIGTMSQPYLDLFHCDIFTAVKQMPCPLSVQFFHSGSHTVILAAPAEKAVRRVRAILAAGELPAHWLLFRLWSIARGKVSVK